MIKTVTFFIFIFFGCFINAQNIDSLILEDTIVPLQYEELPVYHFFNGGEVASSFSRIASLSSIETQSPFLFFSLLVFSLLICIVFINSRDLVSSGFKAMFNLQFALQFNRTDKQTNTFFYFIYLILFILGFSLLFSFISNQFDLQNLTYLQVLLLVSSFFVLDYLSSYLYLFFTKKNKTLEIIHTVVLSYSVFLSLILWPCLFLILFSTALVSKFFLMLFASFLVLLLVAKEIRVFQILWVEKVDVVSFHFFAYLCTFKFLPIIILVKFVLEVL